MKNNKHILIIRTTLTFLLLGAVTVIYFKDNSQSLESSEFNYNSTDFIHWKNTEYGLKLLEINPLVRNKLKGNGNLLKPNDILTAVEFHPIKNKEELNKLLKKCPPKKILNYSIERMDSSLGIPLYLNFLLEINTLPKYLFITEKYYWNFYFYFTIILLYSSLISFFILFPILIKQFYRLKFLNLFYFTFILGILIVFIRQMGILLGFIFIKPGLDSVLLTFWFIFLTLNLTGLVLYIVKNKIEWIIVLPLFLLLFIGIYRSNYTDSYLRIQAEFEKYQWNIILILSIWSISNLINGFYSRSILKGVVIDLILLSFIVGIIWLLPSSELKQLISLCIPLIPVWLTTYRFMTQGKVKIILTQSLILTFFGTTLIFIYFFIHSIIKDMVINPTYNGIAEVSLLLAVSLFFYVLYYMNKGNISNYFINTLSGKDKKYSDFINQIPSLLNFPDLFNQAQSTISSYLNSSFIEIYDDRGKDDFKNIIINDYPELSWSFSKLLYPKYLDEKNEKTLSQKEYGMLFISLLKDGRHIWLGVGKKKKGRYNLDEFEKISTLFKQILLECNIILLMEKEKILATQSIKANLKALRAQINPHFLFNTLNTISSLIVHNTELAEKAVDKLASIFRYTLDFSENDLVRLEKEIDLCRDYLLIEKIRFGERLEVIYSMSETLNNQLVPPFCIQTLVENAIKHGITPNIEKGIVKIKTYKEKDYFYIEITDNGKGFDPNSIHTGHGILNIKERFFYLFGEKELVLIGVNLGWTKVTLKLPYKEN